MFVVIFVRSFVIIDVVAITVIVIDITTIVIGHNVIVIINGIDY